MNEKVAYIVGVALGDGNLSIPNGRASRLRITCDAKYPLIAKEITDALQYIFPDNSVAIVHKPGVDTYFNISVYSNRLNDFLPWKVGGGSKEMQNACVPEWILSSKKYSRACLRGLLQTDGSVYTDRGYVMVNFCNNVEDLAIHVYEMLHMHGFRPTITATAAKNKNKTKYTVRVARGAQDLVQYLPLRKE